MSMQLNLIFNRRSKYMNDYNTTIECIFCVHIYCKKEEEC